MSVSSVPSGVQNTNAVQQQKELSRGKEVENDNDKDDAASKAVAQKAAAQKVAIEKIDSQKVDEKKAVVQAASRPSVNASGQIVGSVIDTQA